jgi:hypothetical protein
MYSHSLTASKTPGKMSLKEPSEGLVPSASSGHALLRRPLGSDTPAKTVRVLPEIDRL